MSGRLAKGKACFAGAGSIPAIAPSDGGLAHLLNRGRCFVALEPTGMFSNRVAIMFLNCLFEPVGLQKLRVVVVSTL